MRDFTSNVDDDAIFNARADRSRPDMDPGMDDDDGWENLGSSGSDSSWGSSFGGNDDSFDSGFGSSFDDSPFGGSSFGGDRMGGFGGRSNFGNNSGFSAQYGTPTMQGQQNQQMNQNPEDKFWGTIISGGKGGFNFISAFVKSFKNFDLVKRKDFGHHLLYTGGILGVISLILMIVWTPYMLHFLIASCFSAGLGAIVFMSSMERLAVEGVPSNNQQFSENDGFSSDFEDDWGSEEEISEPNWDTDIDDEPTISDEVWDRTEKDDMFENPMDSMHNNDEAIELPTKDTDELIAELQQQIENNRVDTRMLTKQYLYDMMLSTLETRTPNYAKEKVLDENSNEFLAYCDIVRSASERIAGTGKTKGDLPEVIRVVDKLFYTRLELSRPNWLKDNKISELVSEIVGVCAFDEKTCKKDEAVTGEGFSSGSKIFVKIMKGETAMVTVKDTYLSSTVRDEVLKGKMKMPVVFGIDEEGKEVFSDFKDIHALLVSGAPRSGKSWFIKTLLAQLMMFKKPSEFEFYIIDAKTLTSDFFSLTVPHIRQFLNTDEEIITLLRHLCNEECQRREKIFFEMGGCLNIEDFHKKNPFEKMPYILVVMDEVITISQRMDKEMRNELMTLLKQFTSRLPSVGIRILLVPHVIKNEILDKTITDMIPYRVSVKGDAQAIESVTGAKPKEFPIKLVHMGDIAIKVSNGPVGFAHSPIVSDSNDGFDSFFTFLTNFWLHIEPESFKGSKLENDIRLGLRSPNSYKGIKEEYLQEVNEEKEKLEASRNANRPQRPQRPQKLQKDVVPQDGEVEFKSSSSGPIKISMETNKTTRVRKGYTEENGNGLNASERKELLRGVHDNINGSSSNIRSDDLIS